MTNLVCPECKGEIKIGVAINPGGVFNERVCFSGPTPLNHKTLNMIGVYKCKKCGYSCDDEYNLMEVEE